LVMERFSSQRSSRRSGFAPENAIKRLFDASSPAF
jgi:hypothetical protein